MPAGIAAWHCLILRGNEHTVVRRLSADTLLNGAAFFDAPLHPGDRLAVGPVEFEVLEGFAAETAQAESQATSIAGLESSETAEPPVFEERSRRFERRRLEDRLKLANSQSRLRLRKMIKRLHALRHENVVLQLRSKSGLDPQRFEQERTGWKWIAGRLMKSGHSAEPSKPKSKRRWPRCEEFGRTIAHDCGRQRCA